jgi:hypothetical protein
MNLARNTLTLCLTGLLVAGAAADSCAQSTGAFSWQIVPDVPAEGMGRAHAVLNVSTLGGWGNTGVIGLTGGPEFSAMQTDLETELGPSADFNYWGLTAGIPPKVLTGDFSVNLNLNRAKLDYGAVFDPDDPFSVLQSTEDTWGGILGIGYLDRFGIGVGFKSLDVEFDTGTRTAGSATAWSLGAYGQSGIFELSENSKALVVGGASWLNLGSGTVPVPDGGMAELPENFRASVGFELGTNPGGKLDSDHALYFFSGGYPKILLAGSFGIAHDLADTDPVTTGGDSVAVDRSKTSYLGGIEALAFGFFGARVGYIDTPAGASDVTWGLSLRFQNLLGFDMASVPLVDGSEEQRLTKYSFSLRFTWGRLGLEADPDSNES